ncbi:MAG: hypothetical protein IKV61_03960 [Clostridia bacterium]|nr:hypothetical protein [Clostridia bacterium]
MKSSVFQNKIKNSKILLYVTSILLLVTDVILAVALGIGGELFNSGICVFLTVIFDALLIVAICFSNFRVSYSKKLPIAYIIATLLIDVIIAPILSKSIFTIVAFLLFALFRVAAIIAILFGLLGSVARAKYIKFLTFIFTVAFAGFSVFYVFNVFPNGFYGQGKVGIRNIAYEYNEEEDGYVAKLLNGNRGNTIVIANEFNGKKVVGIDAGIFNSDEVEFVNLECDAGFFIENHTILQNINKKQVITIDYTKIDEARKSIYLNSKGKTTSLAQAYVAFANQITPSGLEKNQVYINFDYSYADLEYAKFETIDTWIGEKGEVFDLVAHAGHLPYVKEYDLENETFLKENYENGGKVINALVYNNQVIIGSEVNESMPNTVISFEHIRKVVVQEDNDSVYNLLTNDVAFSNGGNARYILETDPFNMLGDITQREGFTVSFKYKTTENGQTKTFNELSKILTGDVFIVPEWSLDLPKVSAIEKNQNNFVYGDTLTLSALAQHDAGDKFEYRWVKDGKDSVISYESSYEKNNVKPLTDSGTYKLFVTATPSCTSLTATATVSVDVAVNKKLLNFTWSNTETAVYSGNYQTITASYNENDVINSDTIEGYIDTSIDSKGGFTSTHKDAGTYNYAITLKGDCKDLYTVNANNQFYTWTIKPYEIEVNWDEEEYTYNNEIQMPDIEPIKGIGLEKDTYLSYSVTKYIGDCKSAINHTVKIILDNSIQAGNYKITNYTKDYKINKKVISLTWSSNLFTYNAKSQKPTATANDVCLKDTCLVSVSGEKVAVGNYVAEATLVNTNYTIEDGYTTKEFTIEPKKVTLIWNKNSFVYSSRQQGPTATAVGTCSGDVVGFDYSGYEKDVGMYTAYATIKNLNYEISGSNYYDYSIEQKEVTLRWAKTTTTYSGEEQKPTATVNSVYAGDNCFAIIELDGLGINAGTYNATATLNNSNYKLASTSSSTSFNITKKSLTITANSHAITYGDTPSNAGITYSKDFVNGEDYTVLDGSLNYSYSYSKNDPVGNYTIRISGLEADNYAITYKQGLLTVKEKEISVNIDDKTSIYGANIEQLTSSIVEGALVASDSEPYKLTTVAKSTSNVGNYAIRGTITNANYKVNFIEGTYKITKATLTVQATSKTEVTYGFTGTIPYNFSASTNNGKTATVTGYSSVNSKTNVGEYSYDVNYDTINYNMVKVNVNNFKVVVNPKAVTLSWNPLSSYTLTNYTQLKPLVAGALISDLNLTYTYNAVSGQGGMVENNAPLRNGKYIVIVSLNNANYLLQGSLSTEFTINTPVVTE